MSNETPAPLYQHDSPCCTYLGRHVADESFDLYVCVTNNEPTVLARWGDDGPQYRSGMRFCDTDDALGEARRRAIAAGVLA